MLYHQYSLQHKVLTPQGHDLIMVFPEQHQVLLTAQHNLPSFNQLCTAGWAPKQDAEYYHFASDAQGRRLCLWLGDSLDESGNIALDAYPMRDLFYARPEFGAITGLAWQLYWWRRQHRYCGRCRAPTAEHPHERALQCTQCQHDYYPRINPCIVVLVRKGQQILLAKSRLAPRPYYGLIAGFVEVGESAEACVQRELQEEVSLQVHNIQYVTSQSWPFSNALMLGYSADYLAGELQLADDELIDANFFSREQLPPVPHSNSISGKLIQAWINQDK